MDAARSASFRRPDPVSRPWGFERLAAECRLSLDCVPVDASILRHEGCWWLFYSPATSKVSKISHLHVAWADSLCGPWTPHPGNPVRIDRGSARPGGTPVVINGRIMLPVQDCATTYGGALRPLWIDRPVPGPVARVHHEQMIQTIARLEQ